jgi:hypothetical protein
MEGGTFLSNIYDEDGHLSQFILESLKEGNLPEVELIQAVSHMADCESCANAYADSFNSSELSDVPLGFADEVKRKLSLKKQNNRQFVAYSMKVAVAVCASLVIVFSGAINFISSADSIITKTQPANLSFINTVNTNLKDLSQKLLFKEGFKNENKKK